jgi:hypothetical protein
MLLLYNEQIFGIQLVCISMRYTKTQVSETFKLFTLLLSALANFVASNDNTTLCINAIYSIVWIFIVIAHGTFYIHGQREKQFVALKKIQPRTFITEFFTYCLLITVIIADCLFYSSPNKDWFVLSCLFIFIPGFWSWLKISIYFSGFFINILVNTSLYDWCVYSGFIILIITFSWARHTLSEIKADKHVLSF